MTEYWRNRSIPLGGIFNPNSAVPGGIGQALSFQPLILTIDILVFAHIGPQFLQATDRKPQR